jgi:membrane associated rhomboid family serine protease
MLDDRTYMRTQYRPAWSMTTILLIAVFACFIVQSILGAIYGPAWLDYWFALSTAGIRHGLVYQLITFQFMHGGWLHLLGNMIGLYFFGRAMEESLGRGGLLKLYLLSGTIGGIVYIALAFAFPAHFDHPVVGASAGVFGLIAAFATASPDQPITMLIFFILPVTFPAKVFLLIEAIFSLAGLFGAFGDNIAHGAHLGGMLTGIFFIRGMGVFSRLQFWRPFPRRRDPERQMVAAAPRSVWRSRRQASEELPPAEFISREVDPILEKISAQGIHSLTERERQILEAARHKMAKR